MKDSSVRKIVNVFLTSEVVALINNAFTNCPPAVTKLIDDLEVIESRCSFDSKCAICISFSKKALWHGWLATVDPSMVNAVLPPLPKGITQKFVLLCIAVGTKIARNQIDKANATRGK